MPRPRTFDDASVVLAARGLFWHRGYAATSLSQLQVATGLSQSSLYETYGSKRGLFERALRSYLTAIVVPMLEPLEHPGSGRQELVDYFRAWAGLVRSAPSATPNRGCLMVNTAVELDESHDEVSDLMLDYFVRVRAAMRAALLQVASVTDVEARTDLLSTSQVGLLVVARLQGEAAARTAETIASEIASW